MEGLEYATNLKHIGFYGTESLPDFSSLNKLEQLWIHNYAGSDLMERLNEINAPNLFILELSGSNISGDIDPLLNKHPNISSLYLGNTNLSEIPDELLRLSSLRYLIIMRGNSQIDFLDPRLDQLRDKGVDVS